MHPSERLVTPAPKKTAAGRFLQQLVDSSVPKKRGWLIVAVIALVLAIGLIDFLTGYELSLLVFYFVPVCLAVAGLGPRAGLATAGGCAIVLVFNDYASGPHYTHLYVPVWNALIALSAFSVVVWLLSNLLAIHRETEERVRQRTAALTEEIAERERLEKAVLEISERERRSIGHDLHDGLGQHLTGTAMIGKALVSRLRDGQTNAIADVERIVALVETGIEQSRALAKGLLLAEIEREGLSAALHELAATTRMHFGIDCQFAQKGSVILEENGAATHIYRIAQEAVSNAVRHGRARHLRIQLSGAAGTIELRVSDDGRGIPPPALRSDGLGLRIMAHRASMIGGTLVIQQSSSGGTAVVCRLPQRS